MKFKNGSDKKTVKWLSTQDHAKWAVSESEKSPFVCISDINRMESQFKRAFLINTLIILFTLDLVFSLLGVYQY
ncbi:hypothetical protein B4U80_04718 [Leptotrombidium deliense]|uniref:Uncharacterized protein n=1 Tax=Leptotrombidium deliense TaxID=299467 RepID=A0A443SCA7_9ACAR|nr:hypothetical protein B4U80_04718 [Leptotrombidium deliense]